MKKILLVLTSVRENRIADKILEQVQSELKNYPDMESTVVDFKQMPLPLIDSPHTPSAEEFAPEDENVKTWTKLVDESDAVVFLVAEYNYSYTPVAKNAIDWIYKEWKDKPVSLISYGWAGGTRATKHLRDVLNSTIATKVNDVEANLYFKKDIELDGSPLTDDVKKSINSVLNSL